MVAAVVDRAMGGIEVHARRLVAQGKTSSAETESPASVCLPEYGRLDGGSIKLWRTASA